MCTSSLLIKMKDSFTSGGYHVREVGVALCSTLSDDNIRRSSSLLAERSYSTCHSTHTIAVRSWERGMRCMVDNSCRPVHPGYLTTCVMNYGPRKLSNNRLQKDSTQHTAHITCTRRHSQCSCPDPARAVEVGWSPA